MDASETAKRASQLQPIALGLLRIVAGFLFWQHGVYKLFGWFGGHAVHPFTLFWYAGVLESFTAPLIVVGLLTQPIALVLCGEMAVAFFTQHLPRGFWPVQNHGMQAVQFCFIYLLLATAGPGRFSLDGLWSRGRANRQSLFPVLNQFYPEALTALRIMTAFLFWQFGVRKFFGWLGGRPVPFPALRWFAGLMESFGAPLIAIGVFTRPLAFLFSGEMAVAFWTSHFPRGHLWPIQNGGEPAVLFCFIYLFLVTAGPGKLSIQGLFARTPEKAPAPGIGSS